MKLKEKGKAYEMLIYGLQWVMILGGYYFFPEPSKMFYIFMFLYFVIDLVAVFVYFDKQPYSSFGFHVKLLLQLILLYALLHLIAVRAGCTEDAIMMQYVKSFVFPLIVYRSIDAIWALGANQVRHK